VRRLLIDTSVLIKWFHAEEEADLSAARSIRDAHVRGDCEAHILDLAVYEVGNVLVRALRWPAQEVADQLDDLEAVLGPPLGMDPAWRRAASVLAIDHALSFYDACWAAAARELDVPLVSADRRLLDAGLAESATDASLRLGLPVQ
jgi:predicted nucleic acid-binding protein